MNMDRIRLAIEIATEAGLLADLVKKVEYHQHPLQRKVAAGLARNLIRLGVDMLISIEEE